MAAFTKEIAGLTGCLIKTITKFKPDEENYDLCYKFCKSNFKFHKFLDVNSNYVTRSIENLVKKFQIHSQPERAQHLSDTTKHFLSLGHYPNSDAHYMVLLFLLESAVSPTNASYQLPEHVDPPIVKQQQDSFDWAAYLMEGVEIPSFYDTSSEEMSDLSGAESPSSADNELAKDSDLGEEISDEQYHQTDTSDVVSSSWLTDHVTAVYWDPYSVHRSCENHMIIGHPACNILSDSGSCANTIVTEVQVVRETLWMLMGVVGGCVYNRENLLVNSDVAITHTTPQSLQRALSVFSDLGSQLKMIRDRAEKAVQPDKQVPQVVQGSMFFVRSYINKLQAILQKIEKDVSEKSQFVSILSLLRDLNPIRKQVACVHSVLETCTKERSLLDILWTHLDFYDSMCDSESIDIIFPWLLATLRPYLEITNKWLTEGDLQDPQSEFCVKKNDETSSWRRAFYLDPTNLPLCLEPVAEKILVAGKSWNYVEALSKKQQLEINSSPSLYDEFIHKLLACRGEESGADSNRVRAPSDHTLSTDPPPYLVMSGVDPLFCSSLVQMSSPVSGVSNSTALNTVTDLQFKSDIGTLITDTIRSNIEESIHSRYNKTTASLTDILKTDYHLLEHFNRVRLFLLMEAGDVMHTFCNSLFHRMMSGEQWLSQPFLNSILQESIPDQYSSQLEGMLCVEVDSTVPPVVSLDSLSGFSLQYKVEWPLDVLFPPNIIATYNHVFTFLIQVKLSKWCLIEINIGKYRGYTGEDASKLHKLFLLKAKLLHFVNSLNQYLLTRILHSSGIEFQENISKASDLDSIIQLHEDYVNQIHDRCLLNKKAQIVKEAITRTLKLTITMYNNWARGAKHFSLSEGGRIEAEFLRCIHFLISCLNKHVKRGSFPHLETLAFSLTSLLSGPKIFPPDFV